MILKSRFRSIGGLLFVLPVFEPAALLVAGVVDKLGKDNRPRRRQRSSCPPDDEALWDAHARKDFFFFARRIDRIQWQAQPR